MTERVGRYQLLDPIGVGPSGTVSRAKVFGVAGFERQFAIKRFMPELTSTAVLAQALSAAARAYGSLEHPRIARMSEFGVAQGTTFTAVEYVAGLDALRLIAESKMAGNTLAAGGALALVSQAARAIGYAHGRGLTHLGLAPTNVMITAEGDIKITDFGILAATLPPRPVEVPRLTGRIPYLAPEQLANEATSAATDVFALGVLAYELVTGHRTFRGETAQQVAQSVMAGPPIEPPLPRPIVRVLQRCLARSPFERFPDARALADALDAALRVAPVPGTRKDIGAQVKQAMERIAALHEGEMSGVLALNIGTGPIRMPEVASRATPPSPIAIGRADDFATNEFKRLEVEAGLAAQQQKRSTPVPPGPPSLNQPSATVPDLRPGSLSTVPGVPPIPVPVPPGVAPAPPTPPAPAIGTNTLVGIPGQRPPLAGARPSNPANQVPPAPPQRPGGLPRLPTPRPVPEPGGAESGGPAAGGGAPAAARGASEDPNQRITANLSVPEPIPDPGSVEVEDAELEIAADDQDDLEPVPGAKRPPPLPGEAGAKGPPPPPAGGRDQPRPPVGPLPDEPAAFADGTNVEVPLEPPGYGRAAAAAQVDDDNDAIGPGGTLLVPAPPPPGRPSHAGGGDPGPQDLLPTSSGVGYPPEAPPYGYPAGPPGHAGYSPGTGLGMPLREPDLARSPAGGRSRKPLVLAVASVAAAAVLAVGGWFLHGALSSGNSDGGGSAGNGTTASGGSGSAGSGTTASGGGSSAGGGSALAKPDAAVAVATPDAAVATDAPTKPTELSIVSTPAGARVFLDGADVGVTPLKLPGTRDRHTVALLLPGHELYVAQVDGHGQFSIQLKAVTPGPDFAGIKVLRCKDKDRYYVFVDGKPTGQTCPTERIYTTLGKHTVEVYDIVTETRRKWEIDIKDGRISYRIRIDP